MRIAKFEISPLFNVENLVLRAMSELNGFAGNQSGGVRRQESESRMEEALAFEQQWGRIQDR
jgi:hypothetical protein